MYSLRNRVRRGLQLSRLSTIFYDERKIHTHKFSESFLEPCGANFHQLTPLSFLERTSRLFGDKTAIIYDAMCIKRNYTELFDRCKKLASVLVDEYNISAGDVVSIMAPNTPAMLEAHYGVPGCGAVLHTINTRLTPADIAFQLEHSESKLVFCDVEYIDLMNEALSLINSNHQPEIVGIEDSSHIERKFRYPHPSVWYEDLIEKGSSLHALRPPDNENDAISLCYTSGTTGNPKGVLTHHRGAFLNSLAWQQGWQLPMCPVFLWIVPMFHCNGWTLPWTVVAQAGINVCQRHITTDSLIKAILSHDVTHMAGAPIVMNILLSASEDLKQKVLSKNRNLQYLTAGAPPPVSAINRIHKEMGINVRTAYGLTEVYGPMTSSIHGQDVTEEILHQAYNVCVGDVTVVDTDTRLPVPADSKTIGEVVMKGNIVMKGYLKNERATLEAFEGGWFRTGDLAVLHPNGQFEIKDRAKDVIISGGENIMSVEVESALYSHPAVIGAACIAVPDDYWGECVCAIVELDSSYKTIVSEKDLIQHSRNILAHYKAPKLILFRPLPRTVTGKIQKHILKRQLKEENVKGPSLKA